jgi:hypothetical protein
MSAEDESMTNETAVWSQPVVEGVPEPEEPSIEPDNTYLILAWGGPDHYVLDGPVTHVKYEFFRGRSLLVQGLDVPGLLGLTVDIDGCCGHDPQSYIKVFKEA